MQLIYHHSKIPNFGDDLNAILWPSLAPDLFENHSRTGFLGIGTIIGMPVPQCDFLHIFSSGMGYDRIDHWTIRRKIWCVRGPLSGHLMGSSPEGVLTDGALLTPFILPAPPRPPSSATPRIGVIPHWQSLMFPGWDQACRIAGFELISPINTPQDVLAHLCCMDMILTESLHGAILADTYGIPWRPIATTAQFSLFKWMDWASSMHVPLRINPVPPPNVAAALHYGRLFFANEREFIVHDDVAIQEWKTRSTVTSSSLSRRPKAKSVAKTLLKHARIAHKILGTALGYHPDKTAQALKTAAGNQFFLSAESWRISLRDRMLERLDQLHRDTTGKPLGG